MTYVALTRKYRPQNFDEVVGQEHVTTTLKNAIARSRVAHAYLFAGSRGVGKTTTARILAKALNCADGPTASPCGTCSTCREIANSTSVDVYEIDGASNRGIDEVRSLRENVKYAPSRGRYKIYIIDEVHMLTTEAFNALLKTLEEPPKHVVFILATTQPNKVVSTILSRCQRFDFRRLSETDILARLEFITEQEKIGIDKDAAMLIARRADGSVRDAESILDQVASYTGDSVTKKDVIDVLGICQTDLYFNLVDSFVKSDAKRSLRLVNEVVEGGHDLHQFVLGLGEHLRLLLVVRLEVQSHEVQSLSKDEFDRYASQSASMNPEDLTRLLNIVCRLEVDMKRTSQPRYAVEAVIVKLAKLSSTVVLKDLLNRIERLERNRGEPEIDQIKGRWHGFVEAIRPDDPILSNWLEKADLIDCDGEVLMVGISRSMDHQKKEMSLDSKMKGVEERLSDYYGRKLTIRFMVDEKTPEASPVRDPLTDPMVDSVINIFEGELQNPWD